MNLGGGLAKAACPVTEVCTGCHGDKSHPPGVLHPGEKLLGKRKVTSGQATRSIRVRPPPDDVTDRLGNAR